MKHTRHWVFPKRWRVVVPGQLYRSGQLSKHLVERVLRDEGIGVVVDLTGRANDDEDQAAEEAACRRLGIEHRRFPLSGDGTGNVETYAAAVAAIDQALDDGKRVLVHCAAGLQRTGGVLAMHRILVARESAELVSRDLSGVGLGKKHVNPELIPFLNRNMPEVAMLLEKDGTIDQAPRPLPSVRWIN